MSHPRSLPIHYVCISSFAVSFIVSIYMTVIRFTHGQLYAKRLCKAGLVSKHVSLMYRQITSLVISTKVDPRLVG